MERIEIIDAVGREYNTSNIENGEFSYRGIVFEDNLSRNSEYGIELGDGVSVVLRGNRFENVATEIADEGADLTVLDD